MLSMYFVIPKLPGICICRFVFVSEFVFDQIKINVFVDVFVFDNFKITVFGSVFVFGQVYLNFEPIPELCYCQSNLLKFPDPVTPTQHMHMTHYHLHHPVIYIS